MEECSLSIAVGSGFIRIESVLTKSEEKIIAKGFVRKSINMNVHRATRD